MVGEPRVGGERAWTLMKGRQSTCVKSKLDAMHNLICSEEYCLYDTAKFAMPLNWTAAKRVIEEI